jgi:putative ABC transport system permease protein
MVARMEQVFFLFLPLVAAVALLAGAATTAALGLSAVSARTAELGLRRALGARARDVALQILVELTLTMAAGGVLGVLLGAAGALALARRMALDVGLPWPVVGLGVIVAVASGIAAGLLPARRAAALLPIDALR